ncbi:dipeptide ABC transporter ATP-binding protein, partial [Streptomyces umbrinus]
TPGALAATDARLRETDDVDVLHLAHDRVPWWLASRPDLLVCDEATSALDVSVQAQVLDLLRELQADTGIAYLVIAHNLGVVREISTEVVVMRAGQVVETGPTAAVLASPADPYTRALRRASLDPTTIRGVKPRAVLSAAPDASSPPSPTSPTSPSPVTSVAPASPASSASPASPTTPASEGNRS